MSWIWHVYWWFMIVMAIVGLGIVVADDEESGDNRIATFLTRILLRAPLFYLAWKAIHMSVGV